MLKPLFLGSNHIVITFIYKTQKFLAMGRIIVTALSCMLALFAASTMQAQRVETIETSPTGTLIYTYSDWPTVGVSGSANGGIGAVFNNLDERWEAYGSILYAHPTSGVSMVMEFSANIPLANERYVPQIAGIMLLQGNNSTATSQSGNALGVSAGMSILSRNGRLRLKPYGILGISPHGDDEARQSLEVVMLPGLRLDLTLYQQRLRFHSPKWRSTAGGDVNSRILEYFSGFKLVMNATYMKGSPFIQAGLLTTLGRPTKQEYKW